MLPFSGLPSPDGSGILFSGSSAPERQARTGKRYSGERETAPKKMQTNKLHDSKKKCFTNEALS